jgi:hypothetical protein
MNGPRDVEASQAAKRIMEYLHAHADAADTASGIAIWWLADSPPLPDATIERAMAYLVADGRVERQTLPDGTAVYRSRRTTNPER